MNTVKVQYEIHDVVPEPQPKPTGRSKPKINYRPASAPSTGTKPKPVYKDPISADKMRPERHTSIPTNYNMDEGPQTINNLPPVPQKVHSKPIGRRDIQPRIYSDKPDWNRSLSVPDRDILIMEQDLRVDHYKSRHEIFEQSNIPQPLLTDSETRKLRKKLTSEEHRDRVEHFSFGAVANDPLPFHPHLKHQHGIHERRWIKDSKLPVEHEDWAKPDLKADKTHDAFIHEYHIHKKVMPSQEITMQHSIASVASTFTKAEKQSIKNKVTVK